MLGCCSDCTTDDISISVSQYSSSGLLVDIYDNCINDMILINEVKPVVHRLKCGKACGTDEIVPEFYKVNIINYLCNLFNCIFQCGSYSTAWCQSLIQSLHKKAVCQKLIIIEAFLY